MKTPKLEVEAQVVQQDDGLLARWAKRKQAVQRESKDLQASKQLHGQEHQADLHSSEEASLPTDKDMPPIEMLTEDSDFSGFMSPKVSEQLRRLALRKLFHGAAFNICDGLDDYDEDYTSFAKLGNVVTADIKHRIEMEARKKLEATTASVDAGNQAGDEGSDKVHEQTQTASEARATISEENLYADQHEPPGEPVDETQNKFDQGVSG